MTDNAVKCFAASPALPPRAAIGAKAVDTQDFPSMLEVQKVSYQSFLYSSAKDFSVHSLYGIFSSIFPVSDHAHSATLEFVDYRLGDPRYDYYECIKRGITYTIHYM